MKLQPFKIERFFNKYEFSVDHLLCCSDCESLSLNELLSLADSEMKERWENLQLGYTETKGSPFLRQKISKLYDGIKEDNVLVAAPQELIFLTMQGLLEKGDHVISIFPGYQSLYHIAESIGCDVSKWEVEEGKDGWSINLDKLKKLIRPNTEMIVVNFPHNPTGFLPTKEQFQQIVDVAKENNIILFSDEMYRGLEYNSVDRLPSACEVYDKAISLYGLSKTAGLPGLRIGWIVTKDKSMLEKVGYLKDYTTICPPAAEEVLAAIALDNHDKIVSSRLEIISKNLEILDKFFAANQNKFVWLKPKAGPIAFPRVLYEGSDKFCREIVDTKGILLLPSTVYDFGDEYFRVGFGRKNMPEIIKILDESL